MMLTMVNLMKMMLMIMKMKFMRIMIILMMIMMMIINEYTNQCAHTQNDLVVIVDSDRHEFSSLSRRNSADYV